MAGLVGTLVGGFAGIVGLGCFGLGVWEALQFAISAVGVSLTMMSPHRLVGALTGESDEEMAEDGNRLLKNAGQHGVKTLQYSTTFIICGLVCLFVLPTIL